MKIWFGFSWPIPRFSIVLVDVYETTSVSESKDIGSTPPFESQIRHGHRFWWWVAAIYTYTNESQRENVSLSEYFIFSGITLRVIPKGNSDDLRGHGSKPARFAGT
jgi:hypothetical protein